MKQGLEFCLAAQDFRYTMRIASRPLLLWISSASTATSFQVFHTGIPYSKRQLSTFAVGLAARHRIPGVPIQQTSLRMSSTDTLTTSTTEKALRVALCQFHVTSNKEENHKTALDFIEQAAEKGAQMVVLPEIWNSPYATAAFPVYAESLPDIGDSSAPSSPSSQLLIDAAKELGLWIVGGSIPERSHEDGSERIYNTCLVMNPSGTVVAKHRKMHLFDIDVPGGITFFESETLSPGQTVSHFSSPFGEIGVGICYDIRFGELAMIMRQKHNCSILIYPGAFNMTTGPAHWELLQRSRAIDNQCFVMTASPARTPPPDSNEGSKYPHYVAWGHSTVVSPWGDVVATTDEKASLVIADLDLERIDQVRKALPIGIQKRSDLYHITDTSGSR